MSHDTIESWTDKTAAAAQAVLHGEGRGFAQFLPFIGPAIIASIAYEDPGNFATNIQGGAQFGYTLLWVIVVANLMAMLFQSLSAKLGIVTGKSLATHSRELFPRPLVYFMWVGSEIAAMATDVAEFLGASVGLSLLFGLPMLVSFLFVGIGTYAVLHLQGYGFRPMEIVIASFVSIISLSYLAEFFIAKIDWMAFAVHTVVPQLAGPSSITLAVSIVGATVMPHAIYLHSSLTKDRIQVCNDTERRIVLRYSNIEVLVALGIAGLVNMAMLAVSAAVFFATGNQYVADIATAYKTLIPLMGIAAAGIFLLSLLASGFSSSVVGTMAGQTIMQDFVNFKIPLWVRRVVTMVPALFVILSGLDVTHVLVLSQAVLSIILPIPIIALIVITSRPDIMGEFVNGRITKIAAIVGGCIILVLNIILVAQILGIPMSFV